MKRLTTLAALAALSLAPATAATAQGLTPVLTYTGDPFAVIGGDGPKGSSYAHAATFGLNAPVTPWLTATLVGAWTAGKSLSDETIGDTAGVQGAFNSGDYLWLYQAAPRPHLRGRLFRPDRAHGAVRALGLLVQRRVDLGQ